MGALSPLLPALCILPAILLDPVRLLWPIWLLLVQLAGLLGRGVWGLLRLRGVCGFWACRRRQLIGVRQAAGARR